MTFPKAVRPGQSPHQGDETIVYNRPQPARRAAAPLSPEPVPNWCTLSRSDQVEIHSQGLPIASGRIDMLALDGSLLWLQQDQGKGRALFLHSDGLRVYRRPAPRNA
ncbi:hypothetical protein [Pseudarthrobacter sp. NKDBFgelt]|uniref:hypothetical protein n=1 Tax=Pseudarthrobacter sp. NKDBFgelt TaxID=3384443 RepID=UPI0038D502E0